MELVREHRMFGGRQQVWRHNSTQTGTPMEFALYLPPQAEDRPVPLVTYLSGLTCTWSNVVEKAGAQRRCAELGLAFLAPDTSPRDLDLPGEHESYDFGSGAGFYLDAKQSPWAQNYRMYSYITAEMPMIMADMTGVDIQRQALMGHSMGGHGALVLSLKNPEMYRSVSAFAPICCPINAPWGEKAFAGYLGSDREEWRKWDACALVMEGARVPGLLIDQGDKDEFLREQLKPDLFAKVCHDQGQPLTLNYRVGYDHSYYFMASFIGSHLAWHADRLYAE